jgi:hypothetical protein
MSVVRYRKLPVEVDTIQWTGANLDELTVFTGGLFVPVTPGEGLTSEYTGKVFDALHSTWVLVKTGQRVVQGVLGEFYPIAEDVLAETYEPVDTGFFQPGHTYTRPHHGQPITFVVTAVSTSPDGHTTVAHGWRITPYTNGGWELADADDMDGWTDTTTGDSK